MNKMSETEVAAALKQFSGWTEVGETIQRMIQFPDFLAAMRFVNRIAEAAERDRHHPDILIRYNKVTLTLATHDAGGITEKDFQLARVADTLSPPPPLPPPRVKRAQA